MSASNYLENKLLDHVLGGPDFTRPSTVYVGLLTVTPTDSTITEVTGGSYARVAVTNDATQFPAASSGSKSNANDIVFPTATADWGTIRGVGVWDASTSGNLLTWSVLTATPVYSGATPKLKATKVVFTMD